MASNLLHLLQICVWIASLHILQFEAEPHVGRNPCISKLTCHDCIQTPSCAWCYEPAETFEDHPRCYQPGSQQLHKQCLPQYEYFPHNSFTVRQSKSLSKAKASGGYGSGGFTTSSSSSYSSSGSYGSSSNAYESASGYESDLVQMTPQRVALKLRANEAYSFHVQYAQAEDYPVDLYYLIDLSNFREDDNYDLLGLGSLLAETMRNVTTDLQVGFGTVGRLPHNIERPCTYCTVAHGFRFNHHMTLSKYHDQFSHMVKSIRLSGNLEEPVGGLDAIMQAVECKNNIGWRDNARKVLVFATPNGFHSAGDGKLQGVMRPNDGHCHLDNGEYTYSSVQDYPSITQLNLKIKQNSINVIFAVTEKQISVYHSLINHIEGASMGVLSADASNVVELVKQQYERMSSTVEMKDNATSEVIIKYYSKCVNPSANIESNTNKCGNFKSGEVIDFRLEVFLKECPKDPRKSKQTIQVYPVGVPESLIIDLEMLCTCPCENPGDQGYEENSPKCSNFGTYKCGVCECHPSFTGRKCECRQGEVNGGKTSGCKPPNSSDTVDCSGRGTCNCSQCECDQRTNMNETISGEWCQCDNYSCNRYGGEICGGHGTCECGRCVCTAPWTEDACEVA